MKSWVWKYAEAFEEKKRALCLLCDKYISYNGLPSAIANHLKDIHYKYPCDESKQEQR